MADIQKTVEIVFGGKNELSKTIGAIERDFGQLDTMVGKMTAPLAAVGDSILKLDAALLALAVGGMALAVRESGRFGNTFGEITTLIGDVGAPIDKFRNDVLDYAETSVKSLEEINKAIYARVSAGVDYTKSVEFVAAAERLSIAGLANLGDTTKALVSTLNAYGASTDEATKYSDIMFQTVKLGQTTLGELSTQLAKVTGLAANSGVPFETLSAAVAALTVAGLPTEQALTGIKAALQNIIKPTSESEKMAAALGLQFDATALKTKGFEGVLWDAWKATGGNTDKMAQLFGSVEALNAVLILASDKTGKFKSSLEVMGTAGGSTAEAYGKVVNSFENANQRLENSFKLTLITIGDKLMPQYAGIANSLGDLMKGIKVGVDSGAFDSLFTYLDQVGGTIAQWIDGVAKALPEALKMINFDSLITALNNLRRAFGSYMDDLDMTKPQDLAAVIQFLIERSQADDETQRSTGSLLALAMIIEKVGLGFTIALKFAQEYGVGIGNVFDIVTGGAQVMFNGLQILMTAVKGLILIIEGTIVEMLDKLTFGMFPGLEALKNDITKQGKEIGKAFIIDSEDADRGLERFIKGFGKIGEEIGKGTDAAGKLRDRVGEIGESAANATPPVDSLTDELEMLGKKIVTPQVAVAVDEKQLDTVVQSVARAIPAKKEVKVEPTADEKKLKEQSALIQKAMEVKAKVDVAQIEAAAKTAEALFNNIGERVKGTSDVYQTLVKGLQDPSMSYGMKSELESLLSKEADHRAKAMQQAEELTEQQIKLNKLKLEALTRGDNEITVRADGLKPHLEMIMWEVLEAIQIRASATQAEFLLGYK